MLEMLTTINKLLVLLLFQRLLN